MPLEFGVGGIGFTEVPDERSAVLRAFHESEGGAQPPAGTLEFREHSPGIAARIGGKVVRSILIDYIVHELEVGVASNGVCIKEIGDAKLSQTKLDSLPGQF